MKTFDIIKLAAALLLLGGAVFLGIRHWRAGDGISDRAFFYDLSQKKLFTAARTGVPPIRGLDGPEEDAVRAVVISTSGKPADKNSRKIAYLEKCSPELKRQMEQAQATGTSPQMGRGEALAHRFVKRVEDSEWHPMSTAEAEKILTEWAAPGPDGVTPVVCGP